MVPNYQLSVVEVSKFRIHFQMYYSYYIALLFSYAIAVTTNPEMKTSSIPILISTMYQKSSAFAPKVYTFSVVRQRRFYATVWNKMISFRYSDLLKMSCPETVRHPLKSCFVPKVVRISYICRGNIQRRTHSMRRAKGLMRDTRAYTYANTVVIISMSHPTRYLENQHEYY